MKKTKKSTAKISAPHAIKKTPVEEIAPEEQIVGAPFLGKVSSFQPKRSELTIELEAGVSIGDGLRVKGRQTDLTQRVERLVVSGRAVQSAMAGETAQITVADSVRAGDAVYKVRLR